MFKRRPDTRNAADAPEGLSSERLEQWRMRLRDAVIAARGEQGGQVGQTIGCGEVIDMPVIELVDGQSRRPGRALAWSEITRRWDASQGRLVVLGDPGYGKTVAALTLVGDVNARDEPHAIVAELFSLTDWGRWQVEHPEGRVVDWLAEQLSSTYRELPLDASRRLVAEGFVLAVLEGLDEIATPRQRRACVQAINAYTRGVAPHRPLVLTCRTAEYHELAPDRVDADQVVMLTALQREHVAPILADRTGTRPGWDRVRARHGAGDSTLDELFGSPLRLSLALQAYHDRDAGELLDLTVAQAHGHLWELLLRTPGDTFDDATAAQDREWLAFLAAGMRRTAKKRLMLHELHLMDPDPDGTLRSFRAIVGPAFGLTFGLAFWLVLGPIYGVTFGLVMWLVSGLAVGRDARRGRPGDLAPRTRPPIGLRARAQRTMRPRNVLVGVLVALVFGLLVGPLPGLALALLIALMSMVETGTEAVGGEPPARFAHARPEAVLVASRNSGLILGLACGLGVLLASLIAAPAMGSDLSAGQLVPLSVGLQIGLRYGLGAWLYHHWLRWTLHRRALLPWRLPEFLRWCAEPARGWLRITNAYEFRHDELLEHLATAQPTLERRAP